MSTRIPSSLKWLIDKRARLDAEIQKTRISLEKTKQFIEELSELEKSLVAIDKAFELHEISVDISLIKPVRSHYYQRINLPHGELTRSILTCLRMNDGKPTTKSEIAKFIEMRYPDLETHLGRRSYLLRSIHNRLKCLRRDGVIQRHHSPQTNVDGMWSLVPDKESQ